MSPPSNNFWPIQSHKRIFSDFFGGTSEAHNEWRRSGSKHCFAFYYFISKSSVVTEKAFIYYHVILKVSGGDEVGINPVLKKKKIFILNPILTCL